MQVFVIFVITLFGIMVLAKIILKLYEGMLFEYDPDNPYRRTCTECGQVQEEFGEYHNLNKKGYWETIGPIQDKECPCNFYTRDGWRHFT